MGKNKTKTKKRSTGIFTAPDKGWYQINTLSGYVYKLKDGQSYKLDENGEPIGWIERFTLKKT